MAVPLPILTPCRPRQDNHRDVTCLHLNLSLSNVLLAAAAVGDLLGLGELVADGLGAEVLQGVGLDGVDTQGGVGLDDGETSGHCDDTTV